MNCTHCSAKIPGDALTCPYCNHETPNLAAARAREDEARRHAHQQSLIDATRSRQLSITALEGSAKTAFLWSLSGLVCCLPGSVIGLVLGVRARKAAAALNTPSPWQSMAAMVLSIGVLSLFGFAMILGVISEREKAARVAALREDIRSAVSAAELDAPTACALVEMTLLEGGAGLKGGSLNLFRCEGAVEKTPEGAAVLRDIEYSRRASDPPVRVDGCLSRGSRWKVDAIGTGPGCRAALDGGE